MDFSVGFSDLVSGYRDAMDFVARTTSRAILVHREPLQSGCPNHLGWDQVEQKAFPVYNEGNPFSKTEPTVISSLSLSGILNVPFSGGVACPICRGQGFINCPVSGIVYARIKFRNEDTEYSMENVKLKDHNFKVRIKVTGAVDTELLDNSKHVVIDGMPCKIIDEKVPVGFKEPHSYYYYLNDLH